MMGLREKTCFVRGKWISFSREKIEETFNLNERKNGSKFKRLMEEPDYQKIVDLLIGGKAKWSDTRKNPYESIALLYLLNPFTIQTPQYNKREGGDTLVCYLEGIQI